MLLAQESDNILGFTAFGVEASELMATVQTAMLGNLPYTVLKDALFTHPTAAEGLTLLLANMTSDRWIDFPIAGHDAGETSSTDS